MRTIKEFYMKSGKLALISIIAVFMLTPGVIAQVPNRVGTTAANFLEVGFGAAATAMGDSYVADANDVSSIYWNPAGLAYMENSAAMFTVKPWIANINMGFAGVGVPIPNIGTLGLGIVYVNYGQMEVTTLDMQDGTGEEFSASDYAFSLTYSRKIAEWFSFGLSAKYISSSIWHTSASAFAMDLGVIVKTNFFSPTSQRESGMKIGMSISNYGTKMQYDGMDLLNPIDILPYESGNYAYVPGQFRLSSWELPLIFRIGISITPIVTNSSRLKLEVGALHPNNNYESVNVGGQYMLDVISFGTLYFRGGYKALFMQNSEYGLTLGAGFKLQLPQNIHVQVDYSYQAMGIFGYVNSYSVNVAF